MTKDDCRGCYDDHYNQKGNSMDGQCWSFDPDKPVQVRFYVHRDSPMGGPGTRKNYHKERRTKCYRRQGGIFVDKIPSYAED